MYLYFEYKNFFVGEKVPEKSNRQLLQGSFFWDTLYALKLWLKKDTLSATLAPSWCVSYKTNQLKMVVKYTRWLPKKLGSVSLIPKGTNEL